jgi:methyl-accepting chemotaxis protein
MSFNFHEINGKMSLRKQIMLLFITISVIPVILMGIFIFSKTYKKMSSTQESMLMAHADGVKNSIDTMVNDSRSILRSLSAQPDLLLLLEDEAVDGIIHERSHLFKVEINLENAVKSSEKLYETIIIANEKGKIIADGSKNNENYKKINVLNTDYFNKIKNGEEFYVGEPFKSNVTNNFVIPVALTIKSLTSRMGIMVIMFDLEKFVVSMDNIKIGEEGHLFIVSQDENIVYHADKEKLLEKVENSLVKEQINKIKHEDVNEAVRGIGKYKEGNKTNISAYNSVGSTGWLVITSMSEKEFNSSIASVGGYIIILVSFIILLSLFVSVRYSKKITAPINLIGEMMKEVASGNTKVHAEFSSSREIKSLSENFNIMTNNLNNLMSEVVEASQMVSSASEKFVNLTANAFESTKQVMESMESISSGTEEQASDLDKGVSEIEELAKNIVKVKENASNMMKASIKTDDIITSAADQINILKNKAQQSESVSEEVCQEVSSLIKSISEVDKILKIINNISEQTNLLALNAAIEAARAGEYGRGFSVVAEQVKVLSQISAAKTKDISKIVRELERKAENVQSIVTENRAIAKEENSAVEITDKSFESIIAEVGKVKKIIIDITKKIDSIDEEKEVMVEIVNNLSVIAGATSEKSKLVSGEAVEQFRIMKEIKENCNELKALSINLNKGLEAFSKSI